mmetsp:Transcript_18292/g.21960  ORF Transcript_18292/g.21960 Transcript_18292/m.21960 type:complete len:217 (-) Transcript_18292:144-794(-)
MTLARGARQLVVQEALEMMVMPGSNFSSFTPMTNIGASAEGAEITTCLAPAFKWADAFSRVVNTPVDSTTKSAPTSPQPISSGFLQEKALTKWPSTLSPSSVASRDPGYLPWTVSYLNIYAMYSGSMNGSFTATTSMSSRARATRMTKRPIRPKPLIPILIFGVVIASGSTATALVTTETLAEVAFRDKDWRSDLVEAIETEAFWTFGAEARMQTL